MAMLRVSLANDVREVRRIHNAVGDFLAEEGVPGRTIHYVQLVIEELVVNVVRYAFDDERAHRIEVDVRTEPQRVAVTVEDDGRPFNPNDATTTLLGVSLEKQRTGGLGIYLVKKLARELAYTRQNDRNRVRVTIDFAQQ
jgi:anti-sigma regulatory factor (Ser/Thr protein kinase)